MTPNSRARVCVVPPDPTWKRHFEAEAEHIAGALGDLVSTIHHVGSTAVPGLCAKPIIDILLVVEDLHILDRRTPALESLGYEALGEHGIVRRRYFRKDDASGVRTHQIHSFKVNDDEIERHLAFRDYLIEHAHVASAYGELKRALAVQYPYDIDAYMDGKDPFIKEHETRALVWWHSRMTA